MLPSQVPGDAGRSPGRSSCRGHPALTSRRRRSATALHSQCRAPGDAGRSPGRSRRALKTRRRRSAKPAAAVKVQSSPRLRMWRQDWSLSGLVAFGTGRFSGRPESDWSLSGLVAFGTGRFSGRPESDRSLSGLVAYGTGRFSGLARQSSGSLPRPPSPAARLASRTSTVMVPLSAEHEGGGGNGGREYTRMRRLRLGRAARVGPTTRKRLAGRGGRLRGASGGQPRPLPAAGQRRARDAASRGVGGADAIREYSSVSRGVSGGPLSVRVLARCCAAAVCGGNSHAQQDVRALAPGSGERREWGTARTRGRTEGGI